ncbi:major vault protein-like [Syngnathus acus]|uniref:major vault protein-like n=1 Tax=Syngnathus acus TaxID=161584 RepID=UPI001885F49E|nr:major vault protein-like [Syngnathus acus]
MVRIPPDHYIHVLDQNTCIARVEIGPQTYHCLDNERVPFAPVPMIVVPPRHYCVVKLKHADLDIRLTGNPFPLHPGEKIQQDVTPLQVVHPNTALRLQALINFMDGTERRVAGTEWLFEGPGTYIPRKEVVVLETIEATVIGENQPIRLRARQEGVDRRGVLRVTGEEWLVRKAGVYLPGAHEEVIDIVNAFLPTDKHLHRFSLHCHIRRATASLASRAALFKLSTPEIITAVHQMELLLPVASAPWVGVVGLRLGKWLRAAGIVGILLRNDRFRRR